MQKALIFDCDGVLADTEPNGHLVAFNEMWRHFGVPWQWSKEQYGEKLKIAGGKERLASLWMDPEFCRACPPPADKTQRDSVIAQWHREKTSIYEKIVGSGKIPPRPGVKRLSIAALEAGWKLAVASTSVPASVAAVLRHVIGNIADEFLNVSGDMVTAKKPAPDIYNLAIERLGVSREHCVAIEDSRNGLLSARAAHLPVIVTVSEYTQREDFSEASLVVDSLGEPDGPFCSVIANTTSQKITSFITLDNIETIMANGVR